MKTQKITKKLELKKVTISKVDEISLTDVRGGVVFSVYPCLSYDRNCVDITRYAPLNSAYPCIPMWC